MGAGNFAAKFWAAQAAQRRGLAGKRDESNYPSYAYEWEQLDRGGKDESIDVGGTVWDRHFVASRSSNVRQIFYSTEGKKLKATFRPSPNKPEADCRYVYFNVPVQVYNRLEYAERSGGSVGAEFWRLMRVKPLAHRYNYRRLGDGGAEGLSRRGIMHVRGMPGLDEAPLHHASTERAIKRAEQYRKKRVEARSARGQAGAGGQSARARKNAGRRI